ncbi:hypothetical protein BpHYR1_033739 [Brachionus plicatilis]|uniref:Uncharacterized protein n=1 Tax=Brachionus plicatilis TaxID=10195 RepID=A0A3M7PL42_BRAPC|nr:hypothetical protein BpHYR1_033739 [Brachionus plicatilis]
MDLKMELRKKGPLYIALRERTSK